MMLRRIARASRAAQWTRGSPGVAAFATRKPATPPASAKATSAPPPEVQSASFDALTLTAEDVKERLRARGVTFQARDRKATLVRLLRESLESEAATKMQEAPSADSSAPAGLTKKKRASSPARTPVPAISVLAHSRPALQPEASAAPTLASVVAHSRLALASQTPAPTPPASAPVPAPAPAAARSESQLADEPFFASLPRAVLLLPRNVALSHDAARLGASPDAPVRARWLGVRDWPLWLKHEAAALALPGAFALGVASDLPAAFAWRLGLAASLAALTHRVSRSAVLGARVRDAARGFALACVGVQLLPALGLDGAAAVAVLGWQARALALVSGAVAIGRLRTATGLPRVRRLAAPRAELVRLTLGAPAPQAPLASAAERALDQALEHVRASSREDVVAALALLGPADTLRPIGWSAVRDLRLPAGGYVDSIDVSGITSLRLAPTRLVTATAHLAGRTGRTVRMQVQMAADGRSDDAAPLHVRHVSISQVERDVALATSAAVAACGHAPEQATQAAEHGEASGRLTRTCSVDDYVEIEWT